MRRLISMGIIVLLDIAVIMGFMLLAGEGLDMAEMVLWQGHIFEDYSFETVVIGVCGLVYLKIIWKLIHRY